MHRRVLVALTLLALMGVGPATAADPPSDADAPPPWIDTVEAPFFFAVIVEDVDRALAWYQQVLGLEPIGGSAAEDGRWRIENLRGERLFVEILYDRRASVVDRAFGFRKVGFQVPDVDAIADRAEAATGERPRIVESAEHRIRILQLKDPEGNTLQLHEPSDRD